MSAFSTLPAHDQDEDDFGMEPKKSFLQVGDARVRMREAHDPHLRGRVGTITTLYGDISYAALEVLLDNGRPELFWHYQLEGAND